MRFLVIDVGGTGLKASVLDARGRRIVDRVWVDTPSPCPPKVLVKALVDLVKPLPAFGRVSVGFPG
jgi:polyphosphate glucokinase